MDISNKGNVFTLTIPILKWDITVEIDLDELKGRG